MATVAARAPKRELAPDWRDALRDAVRRLAMRTGARCCRAQPCRRGRARHPQPDRSVAEHRGRRSADQLARQRPAPISATRCCSCSGSARSLFLPVIALPDCGCSDCEPAGRIGRGLLLAALGAVLLGIALGLTSGSAVSGLPGGWGGALGLAIAHGVDCGVGLIPNPPIAGPARCRAAAVRARRARASAISRSACSRGKGGWLAGLFRRQPRERRAAPRPTEIAEDRGVRRRAAEAEPDRRRRRAGEGRRAGRRAATDRKPVDAAEPRARRQLSTADHRPARAAAREGRAADRPRRARTQRAPARNRARRFPRPRRHRRGPPGPGGHHVRARAGKRHQGQPGDPACRRYRAQHVGTVRARRDHPRPQRDRHRAAQSQARDGDACRSWSEARRSRTRTWPCR